VGRLLVAVVVAAALVTAMVMALVGREPQPAPRAGGKSEVTVHLTSGEGRLRYSVRLSCTPPDPRQAAAVCRSVEAKPIRLIRGFGRSRGCAGGRTGDRLVVEGLVRGEPTVRISRRSCGPVGIADALRGNALMWGLAPYAGGELFERARALAAARRHALQRLAAAR
jgi:hypothetical protein